MSTSDANAVFWTALDELVATSKVVVDRPRHTAHPRHPELIYPLDYGYLEGTTAGDGYGIDVWLGSAATRSVTGIVCTVDLWKRDAELKILLGCTPEDVAIITTFLNSTETLRCNAVQREPQRSGHA